MCSNCSGDDLRPETFASFDVSSPERRQFFAAGEPRERKRYGTSRVWRRVVNSPLTLAIARVCRAAQILQIIGKVDRGHFVNLNLGRLCGEDGTKTGSGGGIEELIEIRVSLDSITEVYSGSRVIQHRNDANLSEENARASAWDDSRAARGELRDTMEGFRRARRLRHVLAYGAFGTIVAIAVWCTIR